MIHLKQRKPNGFELAQQDLAINVKGGELFFKSEAGIHTVSDEKYILRNFASQWGGPGGTELQQKFIDWQSTSEDDALGYTRQLLMPFNGKIHKLFWKSSGLATKTIVKLWHNARDQFATAPSADQIIEISHENNTGTGNDNNLGDMNVVNFKGVKVKAGDHISISLQASPGGTYPADDSLHETMGQLLYSQIIRI